MKKLSLLTVVITAMSLCSSISAATWRVNNNLSADAHFTNVQDAIDSENVSDGDIILIEGGDYDGFSVNKQLTIIGTGYNFRGNEDIEIPMPITKIAGSVNFIGGSEGSSISGLYLSNNLNIGQSNISISKLRIYSIYFTTLSDNSTNNISNVIISNSIVANRIDHTESYDSDTLVLGNLIFSNCCFTYWYIYLNNSSDLTFSGATYDQCFFVNAPSKYSYAGERSTFTNCVFYGFYTTSSETVDGITEIQGYHYVLYRDNENAVSNCVFFGYCFGSTVNAFRDDSYYHTGTDNIIIGDEFLSSGNYYGIKDDSPAKTHGNNGQEVGLYGGSSPFSQGGYPSGPSITHLTLPAKATDSLSVKIKAKIIE